MKLLLIATLLAAAASAQEPAAVYEATSGEVTILVAKWINQIPQGIYPGKTPAVVTGTWITACTSNQATPKLRAVITHKSGAEIATIVEDFGFLNVAGNGLRCGNILKLIDRSAILNVSVITSSVDFPEVSR